MFSYKNTKILFAFVVGLTLSVGVTAFAQWQGPPGAPTACPTTVAGCNTPINVSGALQEKTGAAIFTGLRSKLNLIVDENVVINGAGTTNPLHVRANRADGPIYFRLENTAAPASARNWAIFASNGGGFGFHRLGDNYNPLNFTEDGQSTFARKTTFNQSIRIPAGAQEGYVLTSDALGDATWRPSVGGPGGSSTFLGLTDTPVSYSSANYLVRVNTARTGLEFVNPASIGVTRIIAGNNITISPTSGLGAVTINAAGGSLPNGTTSQTLRHNGSAWVANSIIRNDGSKIGINRDPDTSIFNFSMAVSGGVFSDNFWGENVVTTNNSLLSIQPAGRVGIGTTGPEYKLHTIGHSRLNGNVRLGEGNFPDSGSIVGEQSVNVSGGLALLAGGGSINPEGGQIIFHPKNSSTGTFWVNDSNNNRFRIFAVSSAPAGTPLPKIGDKAALITQQVSTNQVRVGINQNHTADLSSGSHVLHVGGTSVNTSDARLKRDIKGFKGGLDAVQKLRGVSYRWKESFNESDDIQLGLIAQEVEEVLPELVNTGSDGIKSLNYDGLIPVLIEAIKEQQDQIDELKAEVESLK